MQDLKTEDRRLGMSADRRSTAQDARSLQAGCMQLELPLHAWDEGLELKAQDGSKLERWGSVKQGMKILGYKHKSTFYALIKSGVVPARKKRITANGNSPYEIDLLATWEYKQAGLQDACAS